MSKKITRRIRFYAIDWIKTDGSHVGKDSAFLTQILKKNRKADYGTDEQVIISESTDIKLPNISDSAWVLSRIRKSDFPQTSDMNGERVEALNLGEGRGLRDPAHFIVFDNGAIIGAESNKQSRDVATALQFILSTWVHNFGYKYNIKDITINRVIRQRLTPEMFSAVRAINIKSSPNYTKELMSPNDSIRSILEVNDEVQLNIGIEGSKRGRDKGGLKGGLNLLRVILPEAEKADNTFSMLKIEGIRKDGNGKYETINVLDNVMVVKKAVVRLDNNTKGVQPEYMYQSIIEAYTENLGDIMAYLPGRRE